MITKALTNWFFYALLALFVIFLYGPMFGIILLSFQGPDGGLTFPMNGVSLHWIGDLFGSSAWGLWPVYPLPDVWSAGFRPDHRFQLRRWSGLPPWISRRNLPVLSDRHQPDCPLHPRLARHWPDLLPPWA